MKTCLHAILFLFVLFSCQYVAARDEIKFPSQNSLVFVANAGQITDQHYNQRKDIDYKLNALGMDIFIGSGEIHYQFSNPYFADPPSQGFGGQGATAGKQDLGGLWDGQAKENNRVEIYRLDVSLIGANENAKVIAEDKQEFYERYYTGGYEGLVANSHQKIRYQDIYPNIDWILYVNNNELKYDFVVKPGGKVSDIRLRYEGASSLSIKDGALTAVTPFGSITEQQPYSYEANSKKEISTQYVLKNNVLSFETDNYNQTLVIDPQLDWATYYGAHDTWIAAVTGDGAGNIYIGGYTTTAGNIATAGAHQATYVGADGFLAKFNNLGVRQWGTYYGGNGIDELNDIVCDGNGMVYIAGGTNSTTDIATPGGFQTNFHPGPLTAHMDGFLVKFDGSGVRQWGTYYGDTSIDEGRALAVDLANNIYLVGTSYGGTLLTTTGAHQISNAGVTDAFIAKFNASGNRLWATYCGGSNADRGEAVICDNTGSVYLNGIAESNNNIGTPGTHKPAHSTGIGDPDAFLVKFDAAGNRLWGTYYGGSSGEWGGSGNVSWYLRMAYDPSGYIYITGSSASTSGIATPGAHKVTKSSSLSDEAYLAKFDLTGQLQWGTYYGVAGNTGGSSIAVSATGLVYLAGTTQSFSGIATPGSFQTVLGGNIDMYWAVFSPAGKRFEGSYHGGTFPDEGHDIYLDVFGNVYLGGNSSSPNLSTPGSHQTVSTGGRLGFLSKWKDTNDVYIQVPDTAFCKGQQVQIHYWPLNQFNTGNVFTVQLSNASGSFAAPTVIGTLAATTGGNINCVIPAAVPAGNGYRMRIVSSNPVTTSANNAFDIKILDKPTLTLGSNSAICGSTTINLTGSSSIPSLAYSWTGPNSFSSAVQNPVIPVTGHNQAGYYVATVSNQGCLARDSTLVQIGVINAQINSNSPLCVGSTLNLSASTPSPGVSYSWAGPNGFTSNLQNPSITGVTAAAAGTYRVVITSPVCNDTLTTNVSIGTPPATPTAGSNSPVCAGQNINLNANSTTPGVSYSWTGPGSYTSNLQNPTRTGATVAMSGIYSVTATLNGCSATPVSTNVVVNPSPAAPVATNNGPLCAGVALDLFATGQPGAAYQWNGPGSYSSNNQNPTILNATTSHAGTYTVTQTLNGCTSPAASTNVVINNSVTPTINIYPNPNDSVCPGTVVTFVAVQTNGGTAPQYQWYKNGNPISGANLATYQTTTYNNGDYYSCQLTSNAFCAVPQTPMSSNVIMTIVQPVVPSVTITASPGLNVGPWRMITFTAMPVNGGPSPVYQWLRNGQPVIGAISNTWGAANLSDNDVISVVLISSEVCAIPPTDTSNLMTVHINMGIEDERGTGNFNLYPNPNSGYFTIKGSVNAKDVIIDIVNPLGQLVYSEKVNTRGQVLDHGIHLDAASGVYLLKLSSDSGVEVIRFTKQ